MTTLNSNWQEIYRTSKNTGYGNQYVIFYAYATENIADNTSTVHTLIRTTVEGSGNYVSVSSWSAASDTQSTSGGSTVWYAGNDYNLLESAWTVNHNADGTGSVSIGMAFYATYNIESVEYRVTVGLQTIPRASQPSLNTGSIECNGGNAFTIYTNRASGSFTHTLTYGFGSASGTIATGVGDSVSWTPPTSLLNQIPNNSSGTGTIYCKAYSGGTQIGDTKSVGFTLTCNTATPTISASVEELNTLVGTSANYTLIGVSNKKITATVSTKYGSTVGSVILTVLGINYTMSGSGNTYTYTLNSSQSGTYKVTITDSRGLTNSTTITQTEYKYVTPYASSTVFKRTAPTENTGTLTVNGSWFSGLSNTLTATTTLRNTKSSTETTIAATLTTSGDTWTVYAGTSILNSLTYTDAFIATITLTDKFKTVTITANLASAQYALWIGKNTVRVNDLVINSGALQLSNAKEYRYNVGGAGGTAKWIKLGTWSGTSDAMNAIIHIYSSSGYNGRAWQNGEIEVFIKDGWQPDSSTANYAFGVSYLLSHNNFGQTIQARATSSNSIDIWLYSAADYWSSTYSVYVSDGTWTPKNELSDSAPTEGVAQECVGKQICTVSDLLDRTYPVGAIYMSVSSTSPASLFGGTWTQLQDRFLIGAGSTYAVNSTGGARSHTLRALIGACDYNTASIGYAAIDSLNSANSITYQVVGSLITGASTVNHNTPVWDTVQKSNSTDFIPPYLAVYMWKRTA